MIGWVILQMGFVPCTSIIAIVVNGILMYAIRRHGNKNSTDEIMFGMTLSDCVFSVCSLIGSVPKFIRYFKTSYGNFLIIHSLPIFYNYVVVLPVYISKLLMALISIERAMLTFAPIKFKKNWTRRRIICVIYFFFVVATICLVPNLLQLSAKFQNDSLVVEYTDVAQAHLQLFQLYDILFQLVFRMLPIFLVLVLNIATIIGLWRQKKILSTMQAQVRDSASMCQSHNAHLSTWCHGKYVDCKNAKKVSGNNLLLEMKQKTKTKVHPSQTTVGVSYKEPKPVNSGKPAIPHIPVTKACHPAISDENCGHPADSISGTSCTVVTDEGYGAPSTSKEHTSSTIITNLYSHNTVSPDERRISSGISFRVKDATQSGVPSKHDKSMCSSSVGTRAVRHTNSSAESLAKTTAQRRITMTLIIIAVVFVALNVPVNIVATVVIRLYANESFETLDFYLGLVLYLELLNAIINSVIFVARSQKYRAVVFKIFNK